METVHQKNAKVFKAVIPCHYREDCVLEYPTGRTDTEFIKTIHAIHEKTDKLKQRIIKNQI
ncbi:hypothetical protein MUJ63_04390 [Lachnospiraceae bacterium NSJ-143]|nr:hypothetical protein [Lachnospiraceae bacterium NSJ-143]